MSDKRLISRKQLEEILTTGQLHIEESNEPINFVNGSIFGPDSIVLNDIEITEPFYFETSHQITRSLVFGDIKAVHSIELNNVVAGIEIYAGEYGSLSINSNETKDIIIRGGEFKLLEFRGKYDTIYLNDYDAKKIRLHNVTTTIEIAGGIANSIISDGDDSLFECIKLSGGNINSIEMREGNIKELIINKNISNGHIIAFTNICIEILNINETTNYGKITFNGILPHPAGNTVKINNSTLGNVDIISVDLSLYSITIVSSKLVDIFYTNVKLPQKFLTMGKDKESRIQQYVDIYEQMSIVASKRGDKYNTIRFQAYSLATLLKSKSIGCYDRCLLRSYKYSNNFRQSWARGVVFTFLGNVFFYILFVIFTETQITWGLYSFTETWKTIYSLVCDRGPGIFEFLNPLHKINDIRKDDINFCAYFVDYFGRIFTGFGIYQTIQAFRKYGKSGDS